MLHSTTSLGAPDGHSTDRTSTPDLAWLNLVAYWHQQYAASDCGCGDDTAATDFCEDSVAWATTYIGSGTLARI